MRATALLAALLMAGIAGLACPRFTPGAWADEAYYHADLYSRAGDYDKARERCDRALFWNRRHLSAKALLAMIDIYQGRAPVIEVDAYMAAQIKKMDAAFARADAGMDPKRELERVIRLAWWLPETERVKNLVTCARLRLHALQGCRVNGSAASAR